MFFKSFISVIIKIYRSSQHRQLYAITGAIKILKWIINIFDYKGDIMINLSGSYVGTDGVYLSTKPTKRYLKSNNPNKINQAFILSEIIKKLDSVNVIFDVGANVGEISIYFSKMYPNSKIFSIEPLKKNIDYFKKNIQTQFFKCDNITIIEKAVCNYNGKIKITNSLNAENTIILDPKKNKKINKIIISKTEEVDAITLQKLCKQYQINEIDFIKIDIEGAEPLLTDSLQKLKPKIIFMEVSSKNTEISYKQMLGSLIDNYEIYDQNFKAINDCQLFISNLFSQQSGYYKVSKSDVWIIRKDIDKFIKQIKISS